MSSSSAATRLLANNPHIIPLTGPHHRDALKAHILQQRSRRLNNSNNAREVVVGNDVPSRGFLRRMKKHAPAVEEPVVEEPTMEEPTMEEPTMEEPAMEEPAMEEPAMEELEEEILDMEDIIDEELIDTEEEIIDESLEGVPLGNDFGGDGEGEDLDFDVDTEQEGGDFEGDDFEGEDFGSGNPEGGDFDSYNYEGDGTEVDDFAETIEEEIAEVEGADDFVEDIEEEIAEVVEEIAEEVEEVEGEFDDEIVEAIEEEIIEEGLDEEGFGEGDDTGEFNAEDFGENAPGLETDDQQQENFGLMGDDFEPSGGEMPMEGGFEGNGIGEGDDFLGDDAEDDDIPADDIAGGQDPFAEGVVEPLATSNCHQHLYTAFMALGTPAQFFRVALDTTTGTTWVPSLGCKGCNDDWNKFEDKRSITFNPAFEKKKNKFEMIKRDGTKLTGTKGVDVLKLGEVEIEKQMFSQITDVSNDFSLCERTEGVLGLGFSGDESYTSVVDNIADQVKNQVFSVYLPAYPDDYVPNGDGNPFASSALLILGGVSQRHYKGCLTWCRLTADSMGMEHWNIEVEEVKVGFKSVHNKVKTATLDTTSEVIVGPPVQINSFLKVNKAVCYTVDGNVETRTSADCETDQWDMATISCNMEDFAPLIFKLQGRKFTLEKDDMTTFGFEEDGKDYCIVRVAADADAQFWTFGTPWFNKFYTAFNPKGESVGFTEMATYEDFMNEEIDICEGDMELDVDIKEGLEIVEEMEEDLAEEIEDIVDEEEEVFEDAEEVMEEVFETVEENLVDDMIDDMGGDDAFEFEGDDFVTDDMEGDDIIYEFNDTDNAADDLVYDTMFEDTSTEVQSALGLKVGEKTMPVTKKTLAEAAGIFLLATLVVVLLSRRRRSGRTRLRETEMGARRGPFDEYRSGNNQRFVID